MISDIIEVGDVLNIGGFLKRSLIHETLFSSCRTLKFGFATKFINSSKAILNKSESCVVNSGKTTQHFLLHRGTHQMDSFF